MIFIKDKYGLISNKIPMKIRSYPILKERYYISGGEQGVFKIRDNMAYNMKYKDGIAVEELVNKIYYYRK